MIVFSLTLFLFSSFTFFYKIRISKKPRTPRSTSWWVCLFKQCQCSRSRCTDFFFCVGLGGGCPRCPPLVWILLCLVRTELVPSTLPECQRWREHSHVTSALAMPVFMGLAGGFSLGALCLSARCVFTCPGADRGVGQLPGADLQAAGPSRLLWKRCQSWTVVLCLPSGNPKAAGSAEKGGWSHLSDITCGEAASVSLPGSCSQCHSSVQLEMDIPRKEHSSSRSATNYFWCYGVFSPVTVKPRQSEGENTKNHWIAKHNSSMSTLSTCQIVNLLVQCTRIQFATPSSFGITYKLSTSNHAEIRWLYSPW